ncbi:response regulator [Anaerostipes sp.]|uniref:response regulator n=1 Tax=Anaerostipes sp. TaxID=1872530 RepID=UPI0025B9C088|nr:response regulator [Anaerostipes sp.]MBS7009756.1 response regulator [Anaerostipes sp.]
MKREKKSGKIKRKIALAAVFVGIILSFLTFLFIQGVKSQLWEQSVSTIKESTQQGCNALKVQLQDDYESLGRLSKYLKQFSKSDSRHLEETLSNYAHAETGVSLYLPDGTCVPAGTKPDEQARKMLLKSDKNKGMIDPHISSVSGLNVFHLFVGVELKDGTKGYLLKEYEVKSIVDSFSLSFYNDTGFSYVINKNGDVLIRSPHPNSNKTMKNLFDMLPEAQNDAEGLSRFAESLKTSQTGLAVFNYQQKDTVFCYTPLKLESDWYVISIIPKDVVNAQTNQILRRSMELIGCILFGIALLVFAYLWYANRANRKMRNQADYIENLYNAIPEGIALISVDQPYHFIQLNRQGRRMLQYPDDPSDHSLKGVLLEHVVYPEDYEGLTDILRNADMDGQKSIFENRIQKADGTYFWASGILERTFDENGVPVFVAAFHDITDEKLAEEAAEREKLQERITLVGAISNAYPVIISMNLTKDTLNFTYVKPGLMIGLGEQKTYSRLFADMLPTVHPDHVSEYKRRFEPHNLSSALGEEKTEVFFEARQMLTDGRYHWTSTQIIYVDNPYSEDKLAVLISRRIDEQRYEEEQHRQALQTALDNANEANRAKSQFLSNMSHDIRTPMNAILGMAAIAAAHIDDRRRISECLEKISLSSRHLLSLINDILDMSKIESGKFSLRKEPFNFAELVADVIELVRPQAGEKKLHLKVQMSSMKNEKVIGDPLRVRQVCINILSNAVKYTPEEGSIHIQVRQEKSSRRGYENYIFCCSDTGIGMSSEFLEKLFQPFERAVDSAGSKMIGTGLGMAITKNVVDLMSGDIEVKSSLGSGSVFTVTLPLQLQNVKQDEIPEEWIGIHSLIVDDDRQACENSAELLESMGLRTAFVTDGESAVEYVKNAKDSADPVKLAMIDWKMPGMDGVETARQIRKEAGQDVPVIILTAYDWSEIETEAREAGVTGFLSKPFYCSKICYLLNELKEEKTFSEPVRLPEKPDYTGKTVLLAEDNELNREIAGTLIREMGVQVEEAVNGEEAVKKVSESEEGHYDMILMDIQMPRMNGYDATKAIRSMKRGDVQHLPIIAMTADAFEEDVRKAMHAGMNEHFAKPIDVKALEQLVYRYLSGNAEKKEKK